MSGDATNSVLTFTLRHQYAPPRLQVRLLVAMDCVQEFFM